MSEKAPKKKAQAKAAPKRRAKPKKTKAKAVKAKVEEEEEKEKVVAQKVDLGPSPRPTVNSRHDFSMHEREARGYSFGELESAGVGVSEVKRLSIPLDIRRRTVLEANVERLKGWYRKPEPNPAGGVVASSSSKTAGSKRAKKPAEGKDQ